MPHVAARRGTAPKCPVPPAVDAPGPSPDARAKLPALRPCQLGCEDLQGRPWWHGGTNWNPRLQQMLRVSCCPKQGQFNELVTWDWKWSICVSICHWYSQSIYLIAPSPGWRLARSQWRANSPMLRTAYQLAMSVHFCFHVFCTLCWHWQTGFMSCVNMFQLISAHQQSHPRGSTGCLAVQVQGSGKSHLGMDLSWAAGQDLNMSGG